MRWIFIKTYVLCLPAHNTQVLGFAVLVCAAVAMGTINNNDRLEAIEDTSDSDLRRFDDQFDTRFEEIKEDIEGSRGTAGWLLFLVIVTTIVEGIWILIRTLNFELVNLRITIFLAIVSCRVLQ